MKDFDRKFCLKTEQRAALEAFMDKKDVFALLPSRPASVSYILPVTYVRGKSGVIGLSFDTAYSGFDQ